MPKVTLIVNHNVYFDTFKNKSKYLNNKNSFLRTPVASDAIERQCSLEKAATIPHLPPHTPLSF
jgi:hypothetical protein